MATIIFRFIAVIMGIIYWENENLMSGFIVFLIFFGIGQIFKKKSSSNVDSDTCSSSSTGNRASCSCPGPQGWQYYTSGVDTWQGYPARKRRCPKCGQRDIDYLEADMSARR